jgi:hypothetical protein
MDEATPGDDVSFAPLVMDYADNGDEIALSIVRDAASNAKNAVLPDRFLEIDDRISTLPCDFSFVDAGLLHHTRWFNDTILMPTLTIGSSMKIPRFR